MYTIHAFEMLTEVVAESKRILDRSAGGRNEGLTDQIRKQEKLTPRPSLTQTMIPTNADRIMHRKQLRRCGRPRRIVRLKLV
jgi:hypothetical protein